MLLHFRLPVLPVNLLLAALCQPVYSQEARTAIAPIRFRDVARSAGLRFVLENHPTPQKNLIETMPGGVAAFDYNGDGLTDIFFTNGASIPSLEKNAPKYWNRLFRNEGGMKFKDVTEEAGVAGAGYSMGTAAADYDNDGDTDLFVAGVYHNTLYRNVGGGRFEDVTANAGIKSDHWSIAGSWFDYDNDGLLDLFVANYAKWSPEVERFCGDRALNLRVYCHPKYYEAEPNQLYRNRGDGTFEDVSESSGIAAHLGKGMGVAFADYDGDGFMDVFVTNDKLPNFLFHNNGDGTFEEVALLAGVALASHGKAISAMAVDFRDYNNDGRPDIFITALAGETFPLFRNEGEGTFRDVTYQSRLAALTDRLSGWSNGFADFNNDGWKDLFTANSHVNDLIERFEASEYKMADSVFANRADGTFINVSPEAGPDFQIRKVHRGHAFADFNNDGKIDIAVSALGAEAELFENVSPPDNTWLLFKLTGIKSNRDGIGARIRVGNQHNMMTSSIGYTSSSHFGVHFGAGKLKAVDQVEIRWPSGIRQVLRNVATNRVVEVREPSQ